MKKIEGQLTIIVVIALTLFAGVVVHAAEQNYEIQVEGMRCAYCAYTVSKNLAALDGVVDESVRVDLERGVATLQSTRALGHELIKRTFLDSGFTVANISRNADLPAAMAPTAPVAKITLDKNQIGSKMVNALGEAAASAPSELRVIAPRALESDILQPLIAGRQQAIKVHYESASGDAVEVTLLQ